MAFSLAARIFYYLAKTLIFFSTVSISLFKTPICSSASSAFFWHISLFSVNFSCSSLQSILPLEMSPSSVTYWAFKLAKISANILETSERGESLVI
jgi:hypothetical protein